jgi:YesN/AraC family two-component response regulator
VNNDKDIDVVFLDESMPGITGLETLSKSKATNPLLPVVMITKNEAEHVMEEAIGSQIADYLIKPVNPNQILLSLKKIIDNKRLVREKTSSDYQQEFRQIFMEINSGLGIEEWADVYRKIINWEIKIDESNSTQMYDILSMQKGEANTEFSKFIAKNYVDWIQRGEGPVMSNQLMRSKVFPHLRDGEPTLFVLLDNLRFDQWKVIEPIITELYRVEEEDFFYSILPTSTQYSRNAIFSGLLPLKLPSASPTGGKTTTKRAAKTCTKMCCSTSCSSALSARKSKANM